MKSMRTQGKLLIACIALISVAALLKADYYKPDFFPIGLTGLNYTGSGQVDNCPYSNVDIEPRWTWNTGTNSEKALIEALGVNCIGCQDAYPRYLIDLDPDDPSENNYLNKVCMELDNVYLLTVSYYVDSTLFTNYYRMEVHKDTSDNYFHLIRDYAPGEGKLFRIEEYV